jgi:light-regulated signal transduction histidine kinase (bacteriophytochrome)
MSSNNENALVADAERRVAAAERELEGFAYAVSHDFRGPLRSILSASMIISEDYGEKLPQPAHDELKRITRSAQKISGLIDALLAYSRLARQVMSVEDVDVSGKAKFLAAGFLRRRDDLEITVDPGITLHCDPVLLDVILQQVLDNAAKFGGTHVHVSAVEGGFSVKDDGVGFEAAQAERIFLPFEKLLGEEYAGAGMGLALVQRAVARH